jgi:hypothetical protein
MSPENIQSSSSKGVFLVFHCVPYEVSPDLERFWQNLHSYLISYGYSLLIITTTKLVTTDIPFVHVPYMLSEYPKIENHSTNSSIAYDYLADHIKDWYAQDRSDAINIFNNVFHFYKTLVKACEPAGIISWQSMHPVSRICKQLSIESGIPWWTAERGWLNGTLMIDSHENNFLSELNYDFSIQSAYKRYETNYALLNKYALNINEKSTLDRYPGIKSDQSQSDLRVQLGIPKSSKIYTFFTHGEPHISSASVFNSLQNQHGINSHIIYENLQSVSTFLAERGDYLLIKEHPFNTIHNRMLPIDGLKNTIRTELGIDTLVSVSDHFLLTLSTIQFDLFLSGKKFGLLSKGILSKNYEAPYINDFANIESFIAEIECDKLWIARKKFIEKKISFLLEYFLHDITEENSEISAIHIGSILNSFVGRSSESSFSRMRQWSLQFTDDQLTSDEFKFDGF